MEYIYKCPLQCPINKHCFVIKLEEFKNGKIYSVDSQSGHFRPNIQSMGKVESALQQLYERNPNLFHKDSKWRKK